MCSTRREFLSPYGIRSVSRVHRDHPYVFRVDGEDYRVEYDPAESTTRAVRRQLELAGAGLVSDQLSGARGARSAITISMATTFTVECPTGSGRMDDAEGSDARVGDAVVVALPARRRRAGVRAMATIGGMRDDPHWRDLVLFHEYFHGDTGAARGRVIRRGGRRW